MSIFDTKLKGIPVDSGFKYQAEAPLDARLVVDSTADLAALVDAHGTYQGMLVYVKNDDKYYYCTDNTKADGWEVLSVDAGNGITVIDGVVSAKAGNNGITVDTNGINHADTSNQASVSASGRKYITEVTLDAYGHVTGLGTGTENVTDTNQKIKAGTATFGANDEINIVAGSNMTITGNTSSKTITIGTNLSSVISHGSTDPNENTASTYYFKY